MPQMDVVQLEERAWTGLDIPCDKTDRDIFYAYIVVIVGKGDLAKFWLSARLNGRQANHLAPNLYKKAIRKNISVQQALKTNRWIKHVLSISTEIEVKEYMDLWQTISDNPQNDHNEDVIIWRWTNNGEYTTKIAYRIQFLEDSNKLKISSPYGKSEPNQSADFLPGH